MNTASYAIMGGDYENGGMASKHLKEMLQKIGADPQVIRRTMIAAYETEMNVVIHAHSGVMRVAVDSAQVDVAVFDEGPGIPDIDQALREGFSTAPSTARELGFGAGMGLPNIRKNTDRFSIQSNVGQGTQVRFAVYLKPQEAGKTAPNSVHVEGTRCCQCLMCLRACPTNAIRVQSGGPQVLEHLCVDCTSCIEACGPRALSIDGPTSLTAPTKDSVLVLPGSFVEQFGAGNGYEALAAAVKKLGFDRVYLSDGWEESLRRAVMAYVRENPSLQPILSPACPAVVNLIVSRFPSLITHLAPFMTPTEALRESLTAPHVVFVPACPSQFTLMRRRSLLTRIEVVPPDVMRKALFPRLTPRNPVPVAAAQTEREVPTQVSGMRHVMKVLDAIENGVMDDCDVLELYACDQGCYGSPFWDEDPFIARRRHELARTDGQSDPNHPAGAIRRIRPLQARAGLRLDADMRRAIEKLGRISELAEKLPGRNCGVCGAATCAALAEDAVLGRAEITACPYRKGNL